MSARRAARSAARRRPMRWRERWLRTGRQPRPTPPTPQAAAKSRDQFDRRHRQGIVLDRFGGQHQPGNHDSAVGRRAFHPGRDPARRQSPGPVGRHHHFVQSAARMCRSARPSPRSRPPMNRIGVPATIRGTFQGTAQGLPGFARQPALSHSGGAGHDLHRARRAVRKLRPSADDPVDPAVGRRRRAAGADGVQDRIQHHGADRRHPADRHRQEERHHDDRFRARGRATARARARSTRSTRPACCASGRS